MYNQLIRIVAGISFWGLTLICGFLTASMWESMETYSRVAGIVITLLTCTMTVHYEVFAVREDIG